MQDATICLQDDSCSICDEKGVILLDFLPKRITIALTEVYNRDLQAPFVKNSVLSVLLLQYENTCKVAMAAVDRNRCELLPHPAFSLS
jgi:hypothetical protein